jgi:hypothetical protein
MGDEWVVREEEWSGIKGGDQEMNEGGWSLRLQNLDR